MRHRKHKNQLGVKKEHREALMSNLSVALIKHGRIKTTLKKAKALRPFVEKVITLAKKADSADDRGRAVYLRRLAASRVRSREAIQQLFNERVQEFTDRPGGYTRIYKIGVRDSDASEMALIELIDGSDEGYGKRRKKSKSSKAKAPKEKAAEAPEEASEEAPAEKATDAEASASEESAPADVADEVVDNGSDAPASEEEKSDNA